MSKESFRVQLMNDIHRRFMALDQLDYSELFHMDDTFRLALCIAFMTLSKESIILKDKNGNEINHNILTDHRSRQGFAFSPNGRYFFYVHDDDHDENSEHTGIHIYYFDNDNFLKFQFNIHSLILHMKQ